MKKITLLTFCSLAVLFGYGQTNIADFEPGGTPAADPFGFGTESSVEIVANPGSTTVNSTANSLQYTRNNPDNMFLGFGFNASINTTDNGNFFQVLVRSENNNIPIQFQIQDDAMPATYNPYVATQTYTGDGEWQLLEFEPMNSGMDFSVNPPVDRGPNTTGMYGQVIVLVNPNSAGAMGDTAFFDEFTQRNASILSTNEFTKTGTSWYVSGSDLVVNGNFSGKSLQIFDISGRLLNTQAIKGSENRIDISNLNTGIYLLTSEKGSAKFVYTR